MGTRKRIDWVEVQWPQPSGLVERFSTVPVDRYIRIEEGSGEPLTKPGG